MGKSKYFFHPLDSKNVEEKPILKCSICNFETPSVPTMENHCLTIHGLKMKLEILDESPKIGHFFKLYHTNCNNLYYICFLVLKKVNFSLITGLPKKVGPRHLFIGQF